MCISLVADNTILTWIEVSPPNFAFQIANMLVQVSIEQNESVQAGPYVSKEASQNLRIWRKDEHIAKAQDEYKQADENAIQNWISEMEEEIQF